MRDASTPKQKPTTKTFHVIHLWFTFLIMWQFKLLIESFSSNQFDEIKHVLFFKNWIQQKFFKFFLFILSNLFHATLEIQCCIQGYVWAHQYYVKASFIYTKTILCDTFKETSRHRHT